jgi:hypothetical protein
VVLLTGTRLEPSGNGGFGGDELQAANTTTSKQTKYFMASPGTVVAVTKI